MVLRFNEWLINQQHRKDHIGDLARNPRMQNIENEFPKRRPDEHKNWADIVIRIADPGQIAVFNDAWQEFLLAKQASKESLD